jgi:hypothetical protein
MTSYKYCRYERTVTDWVPYGSMHVSMESVDCVYNGDKEPGDACDETCPCFEEGPDPDGNSKWDEDERV